MLIRQSFDKAVQFLRDNISTDMQLQQLHILLKVANAHPDSVSHADLAKTTGLTQPSVSRNIKALSVYIVRSGPDQGRKQGAGLIENIPDIYEPRRYATRLTDKGVKFCKTLDNLLEEGCKSTPKNSTKLQEARI